MPCVQKYKLVQTNPQANEPIHRPNSAQKKNRVRYSFSWRTKCMKAINNCKLTDFRLSLTKFRSLVELFRPFRLCLWGLRFGENAKTKRNYLELLFFVNQIPAEKKVLVLIIELSCDILIGMQQTLDKRCQIYANHFTGKKIN